jgi:hypothetical protein
MRLRAARQAESDLTTAKVAADSKADFGSSEGVPRAPSNIFETLWYAAPLKAGAAAGTVEVDLTGMTAQHLTEIHAIRYAWPLGGDGDTCCPGADVSLGLSACVPGACPLLSEMSQLPANPFFATVTGGKCACEAPTVCDE